MASVHDALTHHFRLDAERAGPLASRMAAAGFDPDADVTGEGADNLAAWTLAALAPNQSVGSALNDLSPLRSRLGRLGSVIAGAFDVARTPKGPAALRAVAQSDVIMARDSDGAALALVHTAARDDADPSRLAPMQLVYSSPGQRGKDLRITARLPGHRLVALAIEASGLDRDFADRMADECATSRAVSRAEGHALTRAEGLANV